MARLTIEAGLQQGTQVEFGEGDEIKIGRSSDNGLPIDDTRVSRYHARVVAQGDAYLLEDLDSTNGTRVNEKPVTRKILQTGDVIGVGTTKLLFEGDGTSAIPTIQPTATEPEAPKLAAPKIALNTPPPKARPKFDLPPVKTVKVKLEPGRGKRKGPNGGGDAPKRKRR